ARRRGATAPAGREPGGGLVRLGRGGCPRRPWPGRRPPGAPRSPHLRQAVPRRNRRAARYRPRCGARLIFGESETYPSHPQTMEPPLTRSEREALKAIYRLTHRGDPPEEGAHTGVLAESLGLSPGTVTATVKRLADRGLADHRPYRGVELTAAGRQAAVSCIRRHRIVERFLSDMLGYAWNEAD